MEFKVFKSKKLNGDKNKLFLAQPTMMFKSLSPSESYMIAKHIVKDDDVVRPDRVAVEHYGTTDGLDIILKLMVYLIRSLLIQVKLYGYL